MDPTNEESISMTDGMFTLIVDVQDLWALEVLRALVQRVLFNVGVLPS